MKVFRMILKFFNDIRKFKCADVVGLRSEIKAKKTNHRPLKQTLKTWLWISIVKG